MIGSIHRVACFVLRPPVTSWPAGRGPWWARLRKWVTHVILRYDSETCDACGAAYPLAWIATDEMWAPAYEAVTGISRGEAGLLCPRCFARGVRRLGLNVLFRAEINPWRNVRVICSECETEHTVARDEVEHLNPESYRWLCMECRS